MKAMTLIAVLLIGACSSVRTCGTWEQDIGNRSTGTLEVCGDPEF